MKAPAYISHLFQRFLNKESSSEELQELFDHFGTADEAQLRNLIHNELEKADLTISDDTDKMKQLFSHINKRIDGNHPAEKPVMKLYALRIAASIAAVLVLVSGYFVWQSNSPVKMITAYAPYGKVSRVQLPDSSVVLLNAGTTIAYPERFKGKERMLVLKEGQAYFDIVHKAQPFIVKTSKAAITVLGTSFEVSAFPNEAISSITVASGKVGVLLPGHKNGAVFLLPGERANIESDAISKTSVAQNDIAAWREGRLVFQDQLLTEAMKSLERKYKVQIRIQNTAIQSERITMRLNNQPLSNVMTALSFSSHFKYSMLNDSVVIIK